jgi:hypothetical protein
MSLFGKRKYIDEKIMKIINELDDMGYDTQDIKNVFYEKSAGSILPYRNKINKVINMIERLIDGDENEVLNDDEILNQEEFNDNSLLNVNNLPEILRETILNNK